MATLALSIAGNAIAPGVGGFIGAFAGGLIDNFLLFPALFPTPGMQGPRLNDLSVQVASEGSEMKAILGPKNRTAGTIIWMSDLIEVPTDEHVGKGGGQSITQYTYFVDIAIGLADTTSIPVNAIRKVWADAKVIMDNGKDGDKYEELTFYDGTQTTADPLIVSYEGADNSVPFIKTAYVVIKRLALAAFGNRPPNLSSLIEQSAGLAVSEAIGLLLDRAGLLEEEYDVSRVPNCFHGQVISGLQTTADALSPIMVAYSLNVQESDGKLVFFPRGDETVIDVVADDLCAADEGGSKDEPNRIQFTDSNDFTLPTEVNVQFISSDQDLQQGSQRQRMANELNLMAASVDVQLTMTDTEARSLAKRVLWAARAERQKVEFSLPPKYIELQEGDAVSVTVDNEPFRLVVSEVNRGANFLLRCTGYIGQVQVYNQPEVSITNTTSVASVYNPPPTKGYLFDGPALNSEHLNKVGAYYAVCGTVWEGEQPNWQGAQVWKSTTGTTYSKLADAPTQAALGITVSGPGDGPSLFPDTTNTIVIRLLSGSVASVSEEEWWQGKNACAIQTPSGEWEIISFRTVEVIDSANGIYKLSNLLRGLRGTESLTGTHAETAEPVVILKTDGSVGFVELGTGNIGSTDLYKFPSNGRALANALQYGPVPIQGTTMRPFEPADFNGSFDAGTGDLTLTWTRRSKLFASPYSSGGGGLANDEVPETYNLIFVNGDDPTTGIYRFVTTNSPSYVYTAAEQTADGRSPGASVVQVFLCQVSQVVGRGKFIKGTFVP